VPAARDWTAVARIAGPLAILSVGIFMVARTWRTWPDVMVDFGREAYLAWQLASGRTLYVDVAHFSGPLSPYLNALWFRLFGPGVLVLALVNLVVAAGFTAMLYALVARMAGRLAATAACIFFVAVFACGQYVRIGNYNWVCPYSHELTHGIVLATAALVCLGRYHDTRRTLWVALAGFASGLLVLTKVEALLAGGLAIGVGMVLTLVVERPGPRRVLRLTGAFLGAAAVPLGLTIVWFAPVMPLERIVAWPLGHWLVATRPELVGADFYRKGLGVDDVAGNLGNLAIATGWYGAVVTAVIVIAMLLGRVGRGRIPLVLAAFAIAAVAGHQFGVAWLTHGARPLPLVGALVVGGALVELVRARAAPERAAAATLRAAFAVFALVLLAKLGLYTHVHHYGFALTAPAAVLLVACMVGWLPDAVARWGGDGAVARAAGLGLVAAALVAHVAFMNRYIDAKTYRVGEGRDAIFADDRGRPIERLLAEIETRVGRDETLLVFPEGVMLNFLTRRANPTPYYLFDRTSRQLWGDDTMVRALAARPADWLVLFERGAMAPRATRLHDWIRAHYQPVWRQETPQFRSGGGAIGVQLMQRSG